MAGREIRAARKDKPLGSTRHGLLSPASRDRAASRRRTAESRLRKALKDAAKDPPECQPEGFPEASAAE